MTEGVGILYIPFSQRFPPNPGGHLQPYNPRHLPPLWQPPLHGTVKIKLQLLYTLQNSRYLLELAYRYCNVYLDFRVKPMFDLYPAT
jgi:hypothetical protein